MKIHVTQDTSWHEGKVLHEKHIPGSNNIGMQVYYLVATHNAASKERKICKETINVEISNCMCRRR